MEYQTMPDQCFMDPLDDMFDPYFLADTDDDLDERDYDADLRAEERNLEENREDYDNFLRGFYDEEPDA